MTGLFDSPSGSAAVISHCGRYRLHLRRQLNPTGNRTCVFIMLNPSTADATQDDPTIRKCIKFARSWGYDWLHVVNLFGFRATSPADMKSEPYPVGDDNDRWVRRTACRAGIVVCAWGAHGTHRDRHNVMRQQLAGWDIPTHVLALNKDGTPKHPLYVRDDTVPMPWTAA